MRKKEWDELARIAEEASEHGQVRKEYLRKYSEREFLKQRAEDFLWAFVGAALIAFPLAIAWALI